MSSDFLGALKIGLCHILFSGNNRTFVCSATENEVLHREVTAEALTLNQCKTLRLHHAAQMLKNVKPKDIPQTTEEMLKMQKKERKKVNRQSHQTPVAIAWHGRIKRVCSSEQLGKQVCWC